MMEDVMPLIQAIVSDAEVERLERYRQRLKFPTTKTAVVRTALHEWLDEREHEQAEENQESEKSRNCVPERGNVTK